MTRDVPDPLGTEAEVDSDPGLIMRKGRHRPANALRSVFHMGSALLTLLLLEYVLPVEALTATACVVAAGFWGLEAGQRGKGRLARACKWTMRPLVHPGESKKVNSATWYATALVLVSLTGSAAACAVSVVVLGLGDPAAGFVGRRWGRIRLAERRTLEGSLAFLVAAAAGALGTLLLWHPEVAWPVSGAAALAGAFLGALAELGSSKLDDNLSVPVAAALGAWAAIALLTGDPAPWMVV